jgi:hypothetical protein
LILIGADGRLNEATRRDRVVTVNLTKMQLELVVALAALIAAPPSYGVAVVTLTSPTESPTTVRASSQFSVSGPQQFQSSDTNPFDHTAQASGVNPSGGGGSGATAHLTLDVTAEEIRSSLSGAAGADAMSFLGTAGATYGASFSLDIVADIPTPFYFEAATSTGGDFPEYNDVAYRFYTPGSNQFDFSFGSQDGVSESGAIGGLLLPGVTYRLAFANRGSAFARSPSQSHSSATTMASSRLLIPEPGCIALLGIGVGIYVGVCRRPTRTHPFTRMPHAGTQLTVVRFDHTSSSFLFSISSRNDLSV